VEGEEQVFVIDTSSLLDVRKVFTRAHEKRIFGVLGTLVDKGQLVYPPEVSDEVLRGGEQQPDAACRWIQRTKAKAEQRADLELVGRILRVAPDLIDADSPYEQADPYVIALALALRSDELLLELAGSTSVIVVTEDRNDKPSKLSLTTAAGMVGLPTIPLHALLRIAGITP
jgi:hypothetical protein